MTHSSEDGPSPAETSAADADAPADERERFSWRGTWKVRRWDGQPPAVPTYYVATTDTWNVVKTDGDEPSVAPHPILEADRDTIVLKDEGADDAECERWRVEVAEDRLTVTALTGPHEGAVGVAERTQIDPGEAFDVDFSDDRG